MELKKYLLNSKDIFEILQVSAIVKNTLLLFKLYGIFCIFLQMLKKPGISMLVLL